MDSPPDRYNFVYTIFIIHGIGTLMPWNMFITATDYFTGYKLSEEHIGYEYPHVPNFMQYLTFASQVPNVLFNYLNIFVQLGGNLTVRIVWSITVNMVLFIITIILAMVDTSESPNFFFWVTMLCVVILNMSNGIYANTIFGMAAKLPGKYTGGVILGNNISGTFVSIVSLISSVVSSSTRMAAIYYFITALFVLLICFDTYFALPLINYYRFFDNKDQIEQENQRKKQLSAGETNRTPYLYILKKCGMQCINVFTVFLVTLAIFPAIQAGVRPTNPDFFIPPKYFRSVTCFITFNFFAMLGSILPSFVIWPGPKLLCIPVFLRLIFIPLFLFCNFQVEYKTRTMTVLIENEWIYWILGIIMAFTSGYYSSLAMMYAPGTVEEHHASVAGMFAAAALITGIFCGILLTFLWPYIVT